MSGERPGPPPEQPKKPGFVRRHTPKAVVGGAAALLTAMGAGAFESKKDAVSFAKKTASKKTGEVIVHAKTGQIRDMISYAKK